jgi:hypothetical protein
MWTTKCTSLSLLNSQKKQKPKSLELIANTKNPTKAYDQEKKCNISIWKIGDSKQIAFEILTTSKSQSIENDRKKEKCMLFPGCEKCGWER